MWPATSRGCGHTKNRRSGRNPRPGPHHRAPV